MHAAQIIVMDRGRIVERGTHQELVRAGGHYAQMWALQQQQREAAEVAPDAGQSLPPAIGHA